MNVQERAQRIWYGRQLADGAVRSLLLPAEALYRLGVRLRNEAFRRGAVPQADAGLPVLSVGNVAVGGTGKTPVSHWFASRLADAGHRPAILHGGYAADEPALHRTWSPGMPVIAMRDRVAAAAAAEGMGATVLVLDDGFQHRRLRRDADVVLVAAERWDPGARLLPRGPLREPLSALRRADLVIVTRKTASPAEARRAAGAVTELAGVPVATIHLRAAGFRSPTATPDAASPPHGAADARGEGPALLVSGLAEPGAFEAGVRQAGADVAFHMRFPDHHAYDERDAASIRARAGGGRIITTEKDWVKLQHFLPPTDILLLAQDVVLEEGDEAIAGVLGRFPGRLP